MKIIAEVEAGIMSDEWCFFKPTFSGLYTIQYLLRSAKTSYAKTAVRQNGPAPKRRRQTGRAKPAAPKCNVPIEETSLADRNGLKRPKHRPCIWVIHPCTPL